MKLKKKIVFEIVLFITFAIFIGSIVLNKNIEDMDEIWNYNFANCVAKGLVPYKDFSMVQTPLLSLLAGICLKIFSNSLITMRILAVILCSSIFFIIYKIFDKLKINKSIGILTIIALLFLYSNYLCIDYNFLALLLTLSIIYLELALDMSKKTCNIAIGILGGLTFLSKQSIGGLVCISIVLYKLIFEVYKHKTTKEKINIESILFRIIGGIIPALAIGIYLAINGAWNDFIDYAILGIGAFSNKISYINLIKSDEILIKFLAIYIPISFVIMLIYSIRKKDKNMFIIFALSISMIVVVFPISDNIHFLIGIVPGIIGNVYLLNTLIKKIYSEKMLFLKLFVQAFSNLILLLVLVNGICQECIELNKGKYYSTLNHFEKIPISEDFENTIKYVDDYIKSNDKKTYILNFDAAVYMIPLDIYNKNYDMLMKGNFGSRGEGGLISDIKNTENAVFLVLNKNFGKNWQHPHKVTNYVEKNLNHIGDIDNYEIYER